jgi:uncharacterized protein (TIGR02680 family)
MNSRWQANRIGLLNFWYYDEQEFYFAKGRMLLRGSNGSGKSVTMQSVIPLLLDGDMSPERLDPFRSKDRKMVNYLLEEGDEREERIGYLYLEFCREESATYLTIGMGIRARKGKPLDKWYFALTDNRRIGKELSLTKGEKERMTLTRLELQNRIGNGGVLMERQSEYMEYVNQQIFGFETVGEYKEMIDLLIQLRTPKLSKDFKPTVINEILSESLQPTSDEDLRPMSEAIENMDTMTMNLKARQEGKQAAEKIQKVFDKYNQLFLYEKSSHLVACQDKLTELDKRTASLKQRTFQCEVRIREAREEHGALTVQKEAMEREKDSLSSSNAVVLQRQAMELEEQIQENETALKGKETQLSQKLMQQMENKKKEKQAQDEMWQKQQELLEIGDDMTDLAEDMGFAEHPFFWEEWKKEIDSPYAFSAHEMITKKWTEQIDQGAKLLAEEQQQLRQLDEFVKELDQERRLGEGISRAIAGYESTLTQEQNQLKEAFQKWQESNQVLHLADGELQQINTYVDRYGKESDDTFVRSIVADQYFACQEILKEEKQKDGSAKALLLETVNAAKQELLEWEQNKQPEPARSAEVMESRRKLKEMGITYQEFYQLVEFAPSCSKEECNRLEEALAQMGILDAIVVEERDRHRISQMDSGLCDKYLYRQKGKVKGSLRDVFSLNSASLHPSFGEQVEEVLGNISWENEFGEGAFSVDKHGHYRMGLLEGTVSGTYTACLIGAGARERGRQAKMEELRQRIQEGEGELQGLNERLKQWEERLKLANQERQSCPKEDGLRSAWKNLENKEEEGLRKQEQLIKLEEKIRQKSGQIREIREQAVEIAGKVYLSCQYEIFHQAQLSGDKYQRFLHDLKTGHAFYLSLLSRFQDTQEQAVRLEEDLESIRYETGHMQKGIDKAKLQLTSIQEQMQLTDYAQIQERLEACMNFLRLFPREAERCIRRETEGEEEKKRLLQEADLTQEERSRLKDKEIYLEECYQKEFALGYVELPQDCLEAKAVKDFLEERAGSLSREDVNGKLNQVYFENRGYLNDYQLTQMEIFDDIQAGSNPDYPVARRLDIQARYRGQKVNFQELLTYLGEELEELRQLIQDKDRELFEDILTDTISRKIRSKINNSLAWVRKMNELMAAMNTSSGLRLSLRWRSKTAEQEEQLDTKELVELLKKDYHLMKPEEADKLAGHFRSKVEEARRNARDSEGMISFYQIMKDTLDYRKWFEFQLFFQKAGERQKELTNSMFGTFSGGEKAMSMYVPLFSAVVAKYKGGREDAPRMIALDEAFAGVDNRNIRDMFRLVAQFQFNFIMNSQVLWGDCDTVDALAIYQLIRPENVKFVTVMTYYWNGKNRELLKSEEMVAEQAIRE